MNLSEELAHHEKELTKLLNTFDNYFVYGLSHRADLDELLQKHGFDLSEPIGIIDIITQFCRRYRIGALWNKYRILYIQKQIKLEDYE